MPKDKNTLTRKEELIMLAIHSLKQGAYLIAIVDRLVEVTCRSVSVTSVYFPLERLENSGLIQSAFGEATAVRGGRRKKIYSITESGYRVLDEHKRISDLMWEKYAHLNLPKD